jgi:single-strand DNA-binding protein
LEDLNTVIIEGRLTKEPELKYTSSGASVCNLSIANNERWSQDGEKKEATHYLDLSVWGKVGENCNTYLVKGQKIRVTGTLRQQRWETPEGEKRSKLVVSSQRIAFGDKPKGEGGFLDGQS